MSRDYHALQQVHDVNLVVKENYLSLFFLLSMTSVVLEDKSIEELCDYLSTEITDISEDVLGNLRRHKVDGMIFVQLNEE